MDVAHDLLDKHIVDRNGHELGRVDGIVLDVRPGEPPKLTDLLIGASALGCRVNPTIGRWVHALEHALVLDTCGRSASTAPASKRSTTKSKSTCPPVTPPPTSSSSGSEHGS